MMPLFWREKSSLKGRWRLETVRDMRSFGSNPVSCSETSIKIYGSKEEIRARKSPETVDAPGFAPDASIPVTLYGAEGGIRTLARFNPTTPLAGEPLIATWVLLQLSIAPRQERGGGESGIRTHGRLRVAGFQDRFLQPLGHLSTSGLRPNAKKMIPHFSHIVNCRLQYFSAFFPNSALTWSGVQVIKSNKQREPARRKEQMTL